MSKEQIQIKHGVVVDMIGGVMFVFRDVTPALGEPEMADRIRTLRGQVDFASGHPAQRL